jgi:hypothetical protein
VIDVPLAAAVKVGVGVGALTVRVVVPTDPAKGPILVPVLPMI